MSLLDILRSVLVRPDAPGDESAVTGFHHITDVDDLDMAFTRSNERAVVLFKHDPFCSISSRAHSQVSQVAAPVFLVDVARDRDLSLTVSDQTGVRHESPQTIVLRAGAAVWHASHGSITTTAVSDAVERAKRL